MLAAALLVLAGCAVKGYDLGWRQTDALSGYLGTPRDALSGCSYGAAAPAGPACRAVVREIAARLAALPPSAAAPESLGATCRPEGCAYANGFLRRDIGTALIVPIYKRVVLRQARMRFRFAEGRWHLADLSIRDVSPRGYGPVTVGGLP